MSQTKYAILGIGNILQSDDGIGVYAALYLQKNYTLSPAIEIIQGGVEGMNLLNIFAQYEQVFVLDSISIEDEAGSIYHIPSFELSSFGLQQAGAHEIGILECLDMLALMDGKVPHVDILGMVPESLTLCMGVSNAVLKSFESYILTVLKKLEHYGFSSYKHEEVVSLEDIIESFK